MMLTNTPIAVVAQSLGLSVFQLRAIAPHLGLLVSSEEAADIVEANPGLTTEIDQIIAFIELAEGLRVCKK